MADPGALLDQLRQYLATPRFAVIATVGRDGTPHPAVVHYLLAHDALIVNGRNDRRWVANLQRDPRVSVTVHDIDDPQHWVGLKGIAELLRSGQEARDDAAALAQHYGEDPTAFDDQERLTFRIVPRHVSEYRQTR